MRQLGSLFEKSTGISSCASALAFVAGFLDAATFVRGGGVFCAHVTGNLIVVAATWIAGGRVGWLSAAPLITFLVGVIAVARLDALVARRDASRARCVVLALEASLIALAAALGCMGRDGALRHWIVACLVLAMAAQTTLQRLRPEIGTATTVMTGNLAQCLVDLFAERSRGTGSGAPHAQVVFLFVLGCLLGAASVSTLGFGALLMPLSVLLGFALAPRVSRSPVVPDLGDGAFPEVEPAE
ncbi:MAG: YoaK family protein [Polyangiales bacterium]